MEISGGFYADYKIFIFRNDALIGKLSFLQPDDITNITFGFVLRNFKKRLGKASLLPGYFIDNGFCNNLIKLSKIKPGTTVPEDIPILTAAH
ncbi:MAG: hypothetical protein ABI594_02665 [Ginsengibacter sp.]